MAGETLGNDAIAVIKKSDFHAVELSFTAKKAFPKGAFVEVQADGEVDTVANPVKAIGPISKQSNNSGESVTLYAPFYAVARVKANGSITTGNFVKFDPTQTDNDGEPVYATAASSEESHGLALGDAADGNYLDIGIFVQPRVAP